MVSEQEILRGLAKSIVDFDIIAVERACKDALAMKIPPHRIIAEGMAKGMEKVGKKYEEGEYYLAELVMAGEAARKGLDVLEPQMRKDEAKHNGKVVIGTVKGDIHDIGKNIVIMLLKASLFDVIDLGTDVPAEKFVDAVLREKPDVLAMSAMLNMTMLEMRVVVNETEKAGLRKAIKIIVGGAPVTMDYARSIGADAAAKDAFEGVKTCVSWVKASGNSGG